MSTADNDTKRVKERIMPRLKREDQLRIAVTTVLIAVFVVLYVVPPILDWAGGLARDELLKRYNAPNMADLFGFRFGFAALIAVLTLMLRKILVAEQDWKQGTMDAVTESQRSFKETFFQNQQDFIEELRRRVPRSDVALLNDRREIYTRVKEIFEAVKKRESHGEGLILRATSTFYPLSQELADTEEYFEQVAAFVCQERGPSYHLLIAEQPQSRLEAEMATRINKLNKHRAS